MEIDKSWLISFIKGHFEGLDHISFTNLNVKPLEYLRRNILRLSSIGPALELGSKVHKYAEYLLKGEKFEVEKEWLQFNVRERVNSIQQLLEKSNCKPDSILEIGCGTGAILRELQNRKIGNTYTGIDYSEEAIMYLKENSENIDALTGDITAWDFSLDTHYDLVLLIHVLQHLEDPAAIDRKSTRLNSSHIPLSRMPSSA